MLNKLKKEPTKKQDKIWLIIDLSIGTIGLVEWLIQLLLGGTSSPAIYIAIIAYISAIKTAIKLRRNKYKTDVKGDANKGTISMDNPRENQ